MNYLEAEIEKLIAQRNVFLKTGTAALRAYNSTMYPNDLLKSIARRDIHRAVAINDKIIQLKKDNEDFKELFHSRPIRVIPGGKE